MLYPYVQAFHNLGTILPHGLYAHIYHISGLRHAATSGSRDDSSRPKSQKSGPLYAHHLIHLASHLTHVQTHTMPEMRYFSTRGGKETLTFEEVSLGGMEGGSSSWVDRLLVKARFSDAYRPC